MRRAARAARDVAEDKQPIAEVMPSVSELTLPPRRYDFRHARAKALALRMAKHRDAVEGSARARDVLNQRGAEVVQRFQKQTEKGATLHAFWWLTRGG